MWIGSSPHVLDNLAIFTTFQFGRTGMFNVLELADLTGPSTGRKLTSHVHHVTGGCLVDCNLLKAFLERTVGTSVIAQCAKRSHVCCESIVHRNFRRPIAVEVGRPPAIVFPRSPSDAVICGSCGLVTVKSLSAGNSSRSRLVKLSSMESGVRYRGYACPNRARRTS